MIVLKGKVVALVGEEHPGNFDAISFVVVIKDVPPFGALDPRSLTFHRSSCSDLTLYIVDIQ